MDGVSALGLRPRPAVRFFFFASSPATPAATSGSAASVAGARERVPLRVPAPVPRTLRFAVSEAGAEDMGASWSSSVGCLSLSPPRLLKSRAPAAETRVAAITLRTAGELNNAPSRDPADCSFVPWPEDSTRFGA
jgi:hypothetical protein